MHTSSYPDFSTHKDSSTSVVIPTRNRSESLQRTLRSLLHQKISPNEVIVIDDCSRDGTSDTCSMWKSAGLLPFHFTFLRLRRNMGPAAARNFGVAHAKGDIVCFTDDDCEPESDWIASIKKTFEDSPMLAGVGGPVVSAGDSRFDFFFDHHRLLNPKFENGSEHPAYLVTANAAYRREWILRVGGFDEDILAPGGEDPGLSFKILMAGGQLHFSKDMHVRHHYASRLRSVYRMFKNYGYGAHLVSKAYPSDRVLGTARSPFVYFLKIAHNCERSEMLPDSLKREKLAPPYLSQLVSELIQLERDYSDRRYNFAQRLMMHVLWVLFRLAYHEGWREAEPVSTQMPHTRL